MRLLLWMTLFLSSFGAVFCQALENSAWNIGPDSIYFQTDSFTVSTLGVFKVKGTYVDTGNVLLLIDFSGPKACDSNIIGSYRMAFTTRNDTMYPSKILDSCGSRSVSLDGALLTRSDPYVGIEKNKMLGFHIYPNPTSGNLIIENNNIGPTFYSIKSLAGKEVSNGELYGYENPVEIFGPNGLYFIEIYSENESYEVIKVIKE